jgi:hypothetical protein
VSSGLKKFQAKRKSVKVCRESYEERSAGGAQALRMPARRAGTTDSGGEVEREPHDRIFGRQPNYGQLIHQGGHPGETESLVAPLSLHLTESPCVVGGGSQFDRDVGAVKRHREVDRPVGIEADRVLTGFGNSRGEGRAAKRRQRKAPEYRLHPIADLSE